MSNVTALKINIDTDVDKLKSAADVLSKNEDVLAALKDNPQEFLSQLGIHVDENTAKAIASHAGSKSASEAAAAAVIHIDF